MQYGTDNHLRQCHGRICSGHPRLRFTHPSKTWIPATVRGHDREPSSPGVDPAEMDRIALAAEQRQRLVQRQADNVGIGTDELDHKSASDALRSIAARFATPFAGGEIGFDVLFRQTLKSHARLYVTLPERFLRRDQTDRGVNAVIAAR